MRETLWATRKFIALQQVIGQLTLVLVVFAPIFLYLTSTFLTNPSLKLFSALPSFIFSSHLVTVLDYRNVSNLKISPCWVSLVMNDVSNNERCVIIPRQIFQNLSITCCKNRNLRTHCILYRTHRVVFHWLNSSRSFGTRYFPSSVDVGCPICRLLTRLAEENMTVCISVNDNLCAPIATFILFLTDFTSASEHPFCAIYKVPNTPSGMH